MMQSQDRDAVALSARTLGALFSYAPGSEQAAPLVAALRDGSWQSQWPWPVANGLAAQFALEDDEPLADAWQRLFIGPWALPAPPWGSVWLDKESVLFGDSLALREWMRANGIGLSEQRAEPEDHFDTLLLLAAWLCESGQDEAFNQLLAWHLLPWSGRFLSVFIAGAGNPFIRLLVSWRKKRWRDGRRGCPARSRISRSTANALTLCPPAGHNAFRDNVTFSLFRTYRFCVYAYSR